MYVFSDKVYISPFSPIWAQPASTAGISSGGLTATSRQLAELKGVTASTPLAGILIDALGCRRWTAGHLGTRLYRPARGPG